MRILPLLAVALIAATGAGVGSGGRLRQVQMEHSPRARIGEISG